MTLVTGVCYPLMVTLVAEACFPFQANGSIVTRRGLPVASRFIGQPFDAPDCFWPRPSATAPVPYTAFDPDAGTGSAGSDLGPTNPSLADAVRSRVSRLRDAETAVGLPASNRRVPADLVTSSGSGLDPDISAEAAHFQAARVARARGVTAEEVRALIRRHTQGPLLGFIGPSRVNVLELNLDLERLRAQAR
jgi:K+-transporting ATPase ATPase C chain